MADFHKLAGMWANRNGNGYNGKVKRDQYSQAALSLLASDRPVRVILVTNNSNHPKSPEFDLCVVDDGEPGSGYGPPPMDEDVAF